MMGIGVIELLILGVIGLLLVAAPVTVVVLLLMSRRNSGPSSANPNLAPCPDCGRLVSLQADSCPQCGRPLQTKK